MLVVDLTEWDAGPNRTRLFAHPLLGRTMPERYRDILGVSDAEYAQLVADVMPGLNMHEEGDK